MMGGKLALKQDLRELEGNLQISLDNLESKFDHSLSEMKSNFLRVESTLTIRMGTIFAASIAILAAIQKLTWLFSRGEVSSVLTRMFATDGFHRMKKAG